MLLLASIAHVRMRKPMLLWIGEVLESGRAALQST